MNNNKRLEAFIEGFKLNEDTGIFECYGNTKGLIDKVKDRAIDGCYRDSIKSHKANNSMPKMFWMHNPFDLPVGSWLDMAEDSKGLHMKGRLSKTTMGRDIEILAKDSALDRFSIGYNIIEEKWNTNDGCNDLIKIDIMEVSWVNFACNDESRLETIKHNLGNGDLPTKREFENMLREQCYLSKREAAKITNYYNPHSKSESIITDLSSELNQLANVLKIS